MFVGKLLNRNKAEVPVSESSDKQVSKEEEEVVREEKRLKRILEMARNVYFERKIVGSINVGRSFGIFSTSLSCDIDGNEEEEVSTDATADKERAEEDKDGKLTRFESIIFSSLVKTIRSLENRAKCYRNRAYTKDLSLSTGISVSDPVLGIASFSISCSATVTSLLALSEGKK
jgi:hypothetical protein